MIMSSTGLNGGQVELWILGVEFLLSWYIHGLLVSHFLLWSMFILAVALPNCKRNL